MLVALGKNDIKTLEDLAYCAADDLVGWTERKDGEATRFEGALAGFELSRAEAEADDHAGAPQGRLVTEADLAPPARKTPAEEEPATA